MRKLGIVVAALACLMLAAVAFAADKPVAAKGQMDIGAFGGVAVPMGKLADKTTDLDSPTGADMKMGYDGGVFFDYFMTPDIALGVDGSYVTMTNNVSSDVKANTMQYGIHGKYVFATSGQMVPYVQVGAAMYSRKIEDKASGASLSLSDSKPGINGGLGIGFKLNESVTLGVNGTYHYTIGKFQPTAETKAADTGLKDWNFATINAVVTFNIPKK